MRFNPSHQSYGSDSLGIESFARRIQEKQLAEGKALYDKHSKYGHNCGGFSQPACPPREGATPEEIAYYEYLVSKTWKGPAQIPHQRMQEEPPPIRLVIPPPGSGSSGGGLSGVNVLVVGVLGLAAYGIYSIVRSKQ
jgi:hypothetical protein